MDSKEYRPRLTEAEMGAVKIFRQRTERRVLIIGDLHSPFIKTGYLEHCVAVRDKYGINRTIFIGDLVDNHYSSFHDTDPDGFGAGEELDRATEHLKKWYGEFPKADVVLGNHDRIIMRKAFAAGLSKRWIKEFGEVLETPGWSFDLEFEYDNVLYIHGEGGGGEKGAITKALNRRKSIVQGHWHTQNHINWNVSEYDRIFGMQIGCGVDDDAYALAYAKYNIKKSIISCGVVLENGELPIIEPMRL